MYCVYIHKFPNNKIYVGITGLKPEIRWKGPYNKYFENAVNKYGWENIEHIIVAKNLSKKDACVLESQLIEQYKSNNKKCGYNITSGGEVGCLGYKHSNEAKQQMSINRTGKKLKRRNKKYKPWNYGKHLSEKQKENLRQKKLGGHLSEETKQKISESLKGREYSNEYKKNVSIRQSGKGNSFYGKHHTEEVRKKLSDNIRGRIYVNNGVNNKRIFEEDLQKYLEMGYKKGRLTPWQS